MLVMKISRDPRNLKKNSKISDAELKYFILRFLHLKGVIHKRSSAQVIMGPTRENIFSYHSSSPLNTICMPYDFILQLG